MKCFTLQILKALLIGCALWPCVSSAVDANKADIGLITTINGDNHMDIVITSGNGNDKGCSAGQLWDIYVGGCTPAVTLRTVSTSRACTCTCPEAGSCTSSQSGTYPVYGWRLPTAGNELISGYGSTTWNACQVVTNACVAGESPGDGGNGTPPPSGTVFYVDAFICNSSHPDYFSGPLETSDKLKIINTYRRFNYGMRCPEEAGYVYWQNSWLKWAKEYITEFPGAGMPEALASMWLKTQNAMNTAAEENGEGKESYASVLNAACSDYTLKKYGVKVDATYILNTGSTCIVN